MLKLSVLIFSILPVVVAGCCSAAEPAAADAALRREAVVRHFSGAQEPRVERAEWSSASIFNVGVHDMGAAENSLARAVCEVLAGEGFGNGHVVRVIDINSMGAGEQDWEVIGEARCRATGE